MTLQQRIDALTESMANIGYAPKSSAYSFGQPQQGVASLIFHEVKFMTKTESQLNEIMAKHNAYAQFDGQYFFITL